MKDDDRVTRARIAACFECAALDAAEIAVQFEKAGRAMVRFAEVVDRAGIKRQRYLGRGG